MVAPWKYEEVQKIKDFIASHKVVGIIGFYKIPADFFQKLRRIYRENGVNIRVARKNLIEKALEQLEAEKPGILKLKDFMINEVALIGTNNMNAFKLFKFVEGSKTPAYARGGEVAPEDIVIPAGDTPFRPGPILSELQRVGIPVAVERGKIVVKKDTVVVKKGEKIPKDIANILTQLDIKPVYLGFDVKAIYEDGIVFSPDQLRIDEEEIKNKLMEFARNAFALAIEIAWTTPETIVPLLQKAHRQAVAVALESGYPEPEVLDLIITKAVKAALAIASRLPSEALDEKTKELIASVGVAQVTTTQAEVKEAKEEKEEKKEEEEKEEEEEAAAGLAALFG